MRTKITGIVLSIVRHSDKHNVVSIYTPTHGRITCLAPAGGTRSKLPRLMLLSTIDTEINITPTKEMYQLRSYSFAELRPSLYTDPMKMTLAMFLADFLNHLLRETQPDAGIWKFIQGSLSLLDVAPLSPNFHLVFISAIAPFVGIQPDLENCNTSNWFDLRAGRYTLRSPAAQRFPTSRQFALALAAVAPYLLQCRLPEALRRAALPHPRRYPSLLCHPYPGIASMNVASCAT